jgi:drug/metabolite transporter (DMT)-like permease
MIAFASNSILTRLAVDGGYIDPSSFALIRVAAGALVLCMIMTVRRGGLPIWRASRIVGVLSLAAYMAGFSLAYLTLDAGLGALILFGVVQMTMFVDGARRGAGPNPRQIIGASIAFAGLLLALWPGPGGQADLMGAVFMVIAGLGWAVYSISGRSEGDPLAVTAANFLLCLPFMCLLLIGPTLNASVTGVALAIVCGGLTSGLGYALWYRVLPRMQQATAAVVQLSVPILAILAGAAFLGEALTPLLLFAAALVVGGIAMAVTSRSAPADRR